MHTSDSPIKKALDIFGMIVTTLVLAFLSVVLVAVIVYLTSLRQSASAVVTQELIQAATPVAQVVVFVIAMWGLLATFFVAMRDSERKQLGSALGMGMLTCNIMAMSIPGAPMMPAELASVPSPRAERWSDFVRYSPVCLVLPRVAWRTWRDALTI